MVLALLSQKITRRLDATRSYSKFLTVLSFDGHPQPSWSCDLRKEGNNGSFGTADWFTVL